MRIRFENIRYFIQNIIIKVHLTNLLFIFQSCQSIHYTGGMRTDNLNALSYTRQQSLHVTTEDYT